MNGSVVRKWMEKQKMRPEELAVQLNVSLSTVNNILNDKKCHKHTIAILAILMGIHEKEPINRPKKESSASKAG